MKVFDSRWEGAHGIGRFAVEVRRRLSGYVPISLGGSPVSPADPLVLRYGLRKLGAKFFFSPGFNAPLGSPCPFAFCIHDLNHLFVPENSSLLKRSYYSHIVRPAIHRANAVLTVSDFSRKAICEWAGVDESRVTNVGNGVSDAFTVAGPVYRVEREYFLYVGNHKAHKNFGRLLQAFSASNLVDDFCLLSTGNPSGELLNQIDRYGLRHRVSFLGTISDEKLASVYRGATALVFVSLYEGFGLPIVEAMSCGTPVITSSVASMPEIAGGAAILVDPLDSGAIRAAMESVATDRNLRDSLRIRGLRRALDFSWDITARRISEVLSSY